MVVGSKVGVIDDDITGIIILIRNKLITIRTYDGFEMEYASNELVVMDGAMANVQIGPSDVAKIRNIDLDSKRSKKTTEKRSKVDTANAMEVDLHINQLINTTKGLDNYDMLNIQMDEAKKQLEFAIKKRIQRIVFIHGVGAGVLRAELEFLFKQYDNIKYYDANYQKYGSGATEVYIFQNTKN